MTNPAISAGDDVVDEAVEVVGGRECMGESEIEQHCHGSRILRIGGGPNGIMRRRTAL